MAQQFVFETCCAWQTARLLCCQQGEVTVTVLQIEYNWDCGYIILILDAGLLSNGTLTILVAVGGAALVLWVCVWTTERWCRLLAGHCCLRGPIVCETTSTRLS